MHLGFVFCFFEILLLVSFVLELTRNLPAPAFQVLGLKSRTSTPAILLFRFVCARACVRVRAGTGVCCWVWLL